VIFAFLMFRDEFEWIGSGLRMIFYEMDLVMD
jgi:hypothetical protein